MDKRLGDGKSVYPQESQRVGADVSRGVRGKISASGDERTCGRSAQIGVLGNRKALGDILSGNRCGSRSRALSNPIGSDLQSDENSPNGEERDGPRSVRTGSRGEAEALGRRVLGEGLLREYGGATWQRGIAHFFDIQSRQHNRHDKIADVDDAYTIGLT